MIGDAVETELKLLIDASDIATFEKNFLAGRRCSEIPHRQQLASTYFDTPDLYFRRHGASLRVRHIEGDGWIQTLKGTGKPDAGLHQRDEWETPVAGLRPEPALLAKLVKDDPGWSKILSARALSKPLVPLFTTEVNRTTWMLQLPAGDAVEVALDQGKVEHAESELPINEIELELKAGDPAHLFDFALHLQESVPIHIGNSSKAERGFALCLPQLPEIVKATRVDLRPSMTVEQGFEAIVFNCLRHMEGNADGVIQGSDPESVHQMRVGLRRLHSALKLFKEVAPCPDDLQQEFKWLGGALGGARDQEVLAEKTLPAVAQKFPDRTDMTKLREVALTSAREKRNAASEAVSSTRYARLLLAFTGWVRGVRWREHASRQQLDILSSPVKPFADRAIGKRHRTLLKRGKSLETLDPARRHQARIAAKRVRYTTEFFQSLYKPKKTKTYVSRLSGLQDELGQLNDARIAAELLDDAAKAHPELSSVCGFVHGWLAAQSEADTTRLGKSWKRFRKTAAP